MRHFIDYLARNPELVNRGRQTLHGLNLACWCRPTLACHADVWLLLAGPLRDVPPSAALEAIDVSHGGGPCTKGRRADRGQVANRVDRGDLESGDRL